MPYQDALPYQKMRPFHERRVKLENVGGVGGAQLS